MSKYWKTLTAALVLAGGLSSVAVADGYEPVGKGIAPPPAPSWTGFYGGVEVGGRWLDADWTTTQTFFSNGDPRSPSPISFPTSPRQSFNGGEFRGGVYVGWNQQIAPNWVAGVEALLGYADQDERSNRLPGLEPAGINRTSVEATWDGSVRGRLGALINPSTLVYGAAGVAFQEIEASATCVTVSPIPTDLNCAPIAPGTVFSNSTSETLVGWTVGGGIEKLMHKSWLLRIDYRYANFEDFNFIALRPILDELLGANAKLDTETHTVSVGIAKKF